MEGTRNERVIVLTVSYIIGLVTAYIAFGVTQLETTFKYVYVPAVHTAAVINATDTNTELNTGIVAETKEGLMYINNNALYQLSLRGTEEQAITSDGYHVAISDYLVSPDASQVYFCEVASLELDVCRPFIYDVAGDFVTPVTQSGQRIAFELEQEVYWNEDGSLHY